MSTDTLRQAARKARDDAEAAGFWAEAVTQVAHTPGMHDDVAHLRGWSPVAADAVADLWEAFAADWHPGAELRPLYREALTAAREYLDEGGEG